MHLVLLFAMTVGQFIPELAVVAVVAVVVKVLAELLVMSGKLEVESY